jgi:hypothetical protein
VSVLHDPHFNAGKPCRRGAYLGMSDSGHRSCKCGAVYGRSEAMAPARQIDSFECSICGASMESWNTAWVPTYRLIAGPVSTPKQSPQPDQLNCSKIST